MLIEDTFNNAAVFLFCCLCVCLLLQSPRFKTGLKAKQPSFHNTTTVLVSGWCCVISMEFLRWFLRCYFTGKSAVVSQNVSCVLRLKAQEKLKKNFHNINNNNNNNNRNTWITGPCEGLQENGKIRK